MPTYDYECQKCGHTFEEFQQMSAEPLKKCPECKGKVQRLIGTGAGLLFKGSGFYETDYRSDAYKSDAKKASDSSKSSDSTKSSSSESKKKDSGASKSKKKPAASKAKKK